MCVRGVCVRVCVCVCVACAGFVESIVILFHVIQNGLLFEYHLPHRTGKVLYLYMPLVNRYDAMFIANA